jgi:hypothetical protein
MTMLNEVSNVIRHLEINNCLFEELNFIEVIFENLEKLIITDCNLSLE